MDVGVQFFPAVGPSVQSAAEYWDEALRLVEVADALGYHHVRTVEHYFRPYGGYTPNPIVFLAAASQRSENLRVVTGAVLPVFNHPLKQAGEIGMLDAISKGRLEVGFARAFLPHEFARFGISMDESRARFDEGLDAVTQLLEGEEVAFEGAFHQWPATTSLPRPTQRPRPPFWVAATTSEESFRNAGLNGHGVMVNPMGGQMGALLDVYREAYREAGHAGSPRIMVAFHMFCHESSATARSIAEGPLREYQEAILEAAGEWLDGASSKDYPGYDKMIAAMKSGSLDEQIAAGWAWVGSPDEIAERALAYADSIGGFDIASIQVNFGSVPFDDAERSMRLFASDVMPKIR